MLLRPKSTSTQVLTPFDILFELKWWWSFCQSVTAASPMMHVCALLKAKCRGQCVHYWMWSAEGSVCITECEVQRAVCALLKAKCRGQCVHYWMWSAEGTKNLCLCLKTVYLVKYFQPISQDTTFSSSFLVRLCEILAVLPKLTADWLVSSSDMTRSLAITYCEVSGPVESRTQDLCESRGGHPGLLSLINLQFLWM